MEGLGLEPSTLIVVDTDGSIKQLDSLSSAYPGAADTGLHVITDAFDAALDHPTTVARQIGADALSAQCLECPVDGDLRRRPVPAPLPAAETGFRHPSVYCADLMQLITHVRDRVFGDWPAQYGSISAVSRFPARAARASGCSSGQRLCVPAQHVGAQLLGRRLSRGGLSSMARLAAAISVSGWFAPSEPRHLASVSCAEPGSRRPSSPQAARSEA